MHTVCVTTMYMYMHLMYTLIAHNVHVHIHVHVHVYASQSTHNITHVYSTFITLDYPLAAIMKSTYYIIIPDMVH